MIVREFWLIVIGALTIAGLAWGLRDTRRVIEAPFLYAMGMALILLPQLYVTIISPWRVPDEAFWVFNTMVMLCTIALYHGYFSKLKIKREAGSIVTRWVIDDRKLFQLGLITAAIGTIGYFQVFRMGEIKEWRGWPVYWITLAKFALPGITMMLIAYVQSKKNVRLLYALLFSLFPVLAIVTAGRRSMTIVLPLIYILPFFIYNRKFRPPRWTIVVAGILLFIVVYAFPYWRDEFKHGNYQQVITEQPFSYIIKDIFSPDSEKVLEIVDGMIITGARFRLQKYEWGINAIYNSLIQLYIPGSLISQNLKQSLYIGKSRRELDWVHGAYGIPVASYTAKSGYADLFAQFSFAGALVMYFIGKLFRRVHHAVFFRSDGRAVIFLCFFFTFPATIAYGAIFYGIITQLPIIAVMLFAFHWCVNKRLVRSQPAPANLPSKRLVGQHHLVRSDRRYDS